MYSAWPAAAVKPPWKSTWRTLSVIGWNLLLAAMLYSTEDDQPRTDS